MGDYQTGVQYFEQLCTENTSVNHSATEKKFFRMDIEEFLTGSKNELPSYTAGVFVVFINFIKDYYFNAGNKDKTQLMLYFLQGYKKGDYDSEMSARNAAEEVMKQFLAKMQLDSNAGHPFFTHGFDKIDKIRIVPAEIRSTSRWVGWQCSITFDKPIAICHDPNNWTS